MLTTEYCGCGKCFVGVRRLSRKSDATNSPEKQADQTISAVDSVGGHIIGWADDWEVSGAVDPLTRPELGPWLRDEMGPYSGIAGSAVDRIGRDLKDALNTGWMIMGSGRLLVTYGHDGPWDLNDPNDEMRFTMEALGAQMELRNIQRRSRDTTKQMRELEKPKNKNSYGYRFVRLNPTAGVDHVAIDPVAAEIIRTVAERILADEDGTVSAATECARLNRAEVPSPADYRAAMYGRETKGYRWTVRTLVGILTSEAALGYLMHNDRPVTGRNGHPVRLADPLWDRATRDALITKTSTKKPRGRRAPEGTRLLSGRAFCGTCGQRLVVGRRTNGSPVYRCNGRFLGIPASADCKPAPQMDAEPMDEFVTRSFLRDYGHVQLMRREYDPGTGHAARIQELEASLARLLDDRQAGIYDAPSQTERFRRDFRSQTDELETLKALPSRPAGMHWAFTGQTMADQWRDAVDDAARRELLAQYQVRIALYPRGRKQRLWVHGLDADLESQARIESAERSRAEKEAYLDALASATGYTGRPEDVEDYADANAEAYPQD